MKQKHIFIAIFGTFLEYLDYALYGFSAAIIANVFFPPADEGQMLLQTFGVFAIGHFAKPLGAIVFGHIGDIYGRRRALKYNMLGIAFPTLMIGIMPGYASWGVWSVILLILCRFMQGFFVSGESEGVVLYMVEHFKHKHRCFANALVCIMSMSGFVVASFIVMQLKQFNPAFEAYLWRMPFIAAGLLGGVMLILRRQLAETPFFKALSNETERERLSFSIIKDQTPHFLMFIVMFGAFGGLYHFTFVFLEKFMAMQTLFSDAMLSKTHFYALMCFVVFNPISGLLGDRFGPRVIALCGGLLVLSHWVCFILFNDWILPYYGIWFATTALSMSLLGVQLHIIGIDFVHAQFRYRFLNLSHTFGSMLLSGTTPVYAMLIYQKFNQASLVYLYPAMLVMSICVAIAVMRFVQMRKEQAIQI